MKLILFNNPVENVLRFFVSGRRNRLFSGSQRGTEASAGLYSLIGSGKTKGFEPCRYLRYMFELLSYARNGDDLQMLLAVFVDREKSDLFVEGCS